MSVATVRLQAEVEQHLEAIASRLQRSKGWVINRALSEYIEKQQLERAPCPTFREWARPWRWPRTRIPFAISFLAATWFVIRSMPAPLLS